jgi:hypothetical protein
MANEATIVPASGADADKDKAASSSTDKHLEAVTKQLAGIQSLIGRFGQELGNLREQVKTQAVRPTVQQGYNYERESAEVDPRDAKLSSIETELEDSRKERQLDRFIRTSGATQKDWEEITSRLAVNEAVYHRFDARAKLDYFASYDAAWKDIQLERFNAAKKVTEEQRVEQDRQREQMKRQASVSGSGATAFEGDIPLDIAKMTSAEMLKKGLVPVDQNDPPSEKPYFG